MNWKKLFDEDRLDRGYDYYLQDRVYDVILTDNSISTKVEGSRSKTYDVKINFSEDNIESLYCTCPYSYADFNCKHMVATLYKMEEISHNTKDNLFKDNQDNSSIFIDLLKNVNENKLRRFIYEKFNQDEDFIDDFINNFQEEFTPEDFYNYENMLENIFNIDIVELYNENGFYQEAPFHKYLESFIEEKISLLYKNKEYSYVLQLLYIIYDSISEKKDVRQYIELDKILVSCNYYLEKIIDIQNTQENEEIFTYLINKISYDYDSDTTIYFIDTCINKFTKINYLKQLDEVLNTIIENNEVSEDILVRKYDLMKKLDYPINNQDIFLQENKKYPKIMEILVNKEIDKKNILNAIDLLNESLEIHGDTYSLEDNLLLLQLYKIQGDDDNSLKILKRILYDFNIKDMFFVQELKTYSYDNWNDEKASLISFYNETYSYDFLNELYVYEKDYDSLYVNLTNNCSNESIEEYRELIEDKYHIQIIEFYKNLILEKSKNAKNISGYTLIMNYLNNMITYQNSNQSVKKLLSILKNKYKARKLFMEKIEEFEILNSLNN